MVYLPSAGWFKSLRWTLLLSAALLQKTVCSEIRPKEGREHRAPIGFDPQCGSECLKVCLRSSHRMPWSINCRRASFAEFTKDGTPIEGNDSNTGILVGRDPYQDFSRLYIPRPKPQYSGIYRCRGVDSNYHSYRTACYCLSIGNETQYRQCKMLNRPRIIVPPTLNITAREGDTVVLPCFTTGARMADIIHFWYRNGTKQESDLHDTFTLRNISKVDEGFVRCVVHDYVYRKAKDSIEFHITVKPALRAIVSRRNLHRLPAEVSMKCPFSNSSMPYDWRVLSKSRQPRSWDRSQANGSISVTLHYMDMNEEANISCITPDGESSTLIMIYKGPTIPEPPKREDNLLNITPYKDPNIKLTVQASFHVGRSRIRYRKELARYITSWDSSGQLTAEQACYLGRQDNPVKVDVIAFHENQYGHRSGFSTPLTWMLLPGAHTRRRQRHLVSLHVRRSGIPPACQQAQTKERNLPSADAFAKTLLASLERFVSSICSCCTVDRPQYESAHPGKLCSQYADSDINDGCRGDGDVTFALTFVIVAPPELTNMKRVLNSRFDTNRTISFGIHWEMSVESHCSFGTYYKDHSCSGTPPNYKVIIDYSYGLCRIDSGLVSPRKPEKRTPTASAETSELYITSATIGVLHTGTAETHVSTPYPTLGAVAQSRGNSRAIESPLLVSLAISLFVLVAL